MTSDEPSAILEVGARPGQVRAGSARHLPRGEAIRRLYRRDVMAAGRAEDEEAAQKQG